MCDLAYVFLLEDLDRVVLAERQVAAVFKAAGAADVEIPDLQQVRGEFESALLASGDSSESDWNAEAAFLRRAVGLGVGS